MNIFLDEHNYQCKEGSSTKRKQKNVREKNSKKIIDKLVRKTVKAEDWENGKSTATHYSPNEIDFLDVKIKLDENRAITTDLFTKPTDTHHFLASDSCHQGHIKRSIAFARPYSTSVYASPWMLPFEGVLTDQFSNTQRAQQK